MSLQEPEHATESDMADWLYEHRHLSSAEALLDAAAGKLVRRDLATLTWVAVPAMQVPQEELDAARKLLIDSGIWIEDQEHHTKPGTPITGPLRQLMQRNCSPEQPVKPAAEEDFLKAS